MPTDNFSWWPWGLASMLATVAGANVVMVHAALSNPSVADTDDHWEDALHQDERIAARDRSRRLGWNVSISVCEGDGSRVAQDKCEVDIRVKDAQGRPLSNLEGSYALRRSDTAAYDLDLRLEERGPGHYIADWPASSPRGLYSGALVLVGDDDGARFEHHGQLWVER